MMTTYELCPLCGEEVELTTDKLQARKQAGTIDGNGDGIYNR